MESPPPRISQVDPDPAGSMEAQLNTASDVDKGASCLRRVGLEFREAELVIRTDSESRMHILKDIRWWWWRGFYRQSRGIPLSNTNQLWGLLWGILVFGELHGHAASLYAQVIGGSLITAAGAAASLVW